jgi:hypothetical protein
MEDELMSTRTKPATTTLPPQPRSSDPGLAALEAAAYAIDERAYLQARKAIDWSKRPPEDFVRAVDLAFMAGAYGAARNLSREGAERYPDHAELQKMAHILAPPTVRVGKTGPHPGIAEDRRWLKANWGKYRGQWVALKEGQLLGVADSFDKLVEQVGEIRNTGILVTRLW